VGNEKFEEVMGGEENVLESIDLSSDLEEHAMGVNRKMEWVFWMKTKMKNMRKSWVERRTVRSQ
jgi:hypothetical protein